MELTESLVTLVGETAQALKGSARRVFMARTVAELGRGDSGGRSGSGAGAA